MVIDQKRCIGCDACTIACRQVHGTSRGILYAKIIKYEIGQYPNAKLAFLPLLCMHCAEPPCVEVCPTEATYKREDGIVAVDSEKCIGCRNCVIACPYGSRDSFKIRKTYFQDEKTKYEVFHEKDHVAGKVEKCDLCLSRVLKGKDPACVEACPAEARIFGDLSDTESQVSRLIKERHGIQLNPDLNTDPSIYYI